MSPKYTALSFALPLSFALHAQQLVPVWGGSFGASGSDSGTGIALDNAGHVYITGSFTGTTDIDPGAGIHELTSAGSNDIYVAKFDTAGALIWARAMGGAYNDAATAIAVDDAGGVYITGGFCGSADFDPGPDQFIMTAATTGQNDIFIAKLDAEGDLVWAKGVVGGTWWDAGYGIAVDGAGDVIVTGRFYYQGGPRDFDPGPGVFLLTAGHEDIFVLKLDGNGDFVWAEAFGTAPDESRGYSMAVDTTGHIFITGYYRGTVDFDPGPDAFNMTSVGTWNIFYLKLDADGALVWVRSLPVSTTTYYTDGGYGRKIALDADGNLLTTGRFNGTVDFDPGAGTQEFSAIGAYDVYVCKYDTAGELVWARATGGSGHDEGYGITTRSDGSIVVVGTFQGSADLDPGPNTTEVNSAGGDDAFILHLSSDGELINATSFGGAEDDRGYAVVESTSGALYLTGWFMGTTDLDPGSGTWSAASAGNNDGYVVKLVVTDGTAIGDPLTFEDEPIGIFPTPAKDHVRIVSGTDLFGQHAVIEIFDATGKRVHAEQVAALMAVHPLDLSKLTSEGLYMVQVRTAGHAAKYARLLLYR